MKRGNVMQTNRQFASAVPASGWLLQRQCACGSHTAGGGECAVCGKKRKTVLQRFARTSADNEGRTAEGIPASVQQVLQSPGKPLEPAARAYMEPRFGHDFGQVRVHSDAKAAASAQAVNALAYTVGCDVVFAEGRYAPATPAGRRLLAHELTHIVQQQGVRADAPLRLAGPADSAAESEAGRMADSVGSVGKDGAMLAAAQAIGRAAPMRTAAVQRQKDGASAHADAGYFTDAPIEDSSPCIEPFTGKSFDSLLKADAITVVEFSSAHCEPCKVLARILQQECNKYKNGKTKVRFYSVDVEADGNEELAAKYAPKSVPHLYVFAGTEQKYHGTEQKSMDFYAQLLAGIVAAGAVPASEEKGKKGLPRWLTTGLYALMGLGLAATGLGIAALAGAAVALLPALGVLALGAVAGGLIGGLWDPFGLSRRTRPVGSEEAEALIRRRYGQYLPKSDKPLHNARIRPVTQAELQMWNRCRHPNTAPEYSAKLTGWTDQGPEPPKTIASPAEEPVCANGARLEHATREQPVIYYATDNRDVAVLIHEGLHAYAHAEFPKQLRNHVNEGAAEYFTRQISKDIGVASTSGYGDRVRNIEKLIPVIGEEALRKAYFQGDFSKADAVLGPCGLQAWAQYLQMGSDMSAEEVLRNRHVNYCAKIKHF